MVKIGDKASMSKRISEEVVQTFAELSGDFNPIHLDEEQAANSIFKGRVAHGILALSLVSAVIGTKLPGNGTIYLEEKSRFIRPVMLNDIITAEVIFSDIIRRDKGIIKLSHKVKNQNDQVVLDGYSIVKVEQLML